MFYKATKVNTRELTIPEIRANDKQIHKLTTVIMRKANNLHPPIRGNAGEESSGFAWDECCLSVAEVSRERKDRGWSLA